MSYRTAGCERGWDFAHILKHNFLIVKVGNEARICDQTFEVDLASELGLPPGKRFELCLDVCWLGGYSKFSGETLRVSIEVKKVPEDLHVGFKTKVSLVSERSGEKMLYRTVPLIVRQGKEGGAPIDRDYELDAGRDSQEFDEMCSSAGKGNGEQINDFIKQHLATDSVRVEVEIEFLVMLLPGKNAADWNFRNLDTKCALATGFMAVYNSSKDFDFVLVGCDGKEVHAHRLILRTQSPVFAAMLAHDMKEAREGRCLIPDASSHTLRMLVKYLYGFPVTEIGNIDEALMVAAEKYDVARLKDICELVLGRNTHGDAMELSFWYEF